jgi:hypothetical protein
VQSLIVNCRLNGIVVASLGTQLVRGRVCKSAHCAALSRPTGHPHLVTYVFSIGCRLAMPRFVFKMLSHRQRRDMPEKATPKSGSSGASDPSCAEYASHDRTGTDAKRPVRSHGIRKSVPLTELHTVRRVAEYV